MLRQSSIKGFTNMTKPKTCVIFFELLFKKWQGKNRFSALFVQQTGMIINGCNHRKRFDWKGEREREWWKESVKAWKQTKSESKQKLIILSDMMWKLFSFDLNMV